MTPSTTQAAVCAAAFGLLTSCALPGPPLGSDDPNLWLEDVTGERALAWVREHNAASQALLQAQPGFAGLKSRLREVLDARDRIPRVSRIGPHLYELWTDETHRRGLWRRAPIASYLSGQPQWETVLDVDALGRAENQSWVFGGASCLPARAEQTADRCMVALSRGGADARVMREFDLARKQFVEDGFVLPEAKSAVYWIDRDQLYVETDFGPGSLTDSGYPRFIKRWRRGTPLAQAQTMIEAAAADVGVRAEVDPTPGAERHLFQRVLNFYERDTFLLRGGELLRVDKPRDAAMVLQRETMLLELRSDYAAGGRTFPAGALIATDFEAFMRGERRFEVLFEPSATRSLARNGVSLTQSRVLLSVLHDVKSEVEELWREGGQWKRRSVALPGAGQAWVAPLHERALAQDPWSETYLLGYQDFLTPESLFAARGGSDERAPVKQRSPLFDAGGMRIEQRFATSRDGTRVPYFVLWPAGAAATSDNPTLLYGYGGFQQSLLPTYQATRGNAWLARGGVFVLANIRGGGEYGPAWHQAALKAHKQRSYDDFIAVAEDLIARRITSAQHLGIMGGSNGGLLVGAVLTQRPELFNAAVCQVPLLDMRRYHKLLAGASWIAEYGDPEQPRDWGWLSRYSPYHQLSAQKRYPLTLFTTSTRDDRVHPAHARKMVARMEALGHPVLYYENIEGGHGGAADAEQAAHLQALEFSYLWLRLGPPPRPAAAPGPT